MSNLRSSSGSIRFKPSPWQGCLAISAVSLAAILAGCGGGSSGSNATGGNSGKGGGSGKGAGGSSGAGGSAQPDAGAKGGASGQTDGGAGDDGPAADGGSPDMSIDTPAGDGGMPDTGPRHLQLYSFDFVSGASFGWNGSMSPRYQLVPATAIMDDSDPANPHPGAIQYTMNYETYGTNAWIETVFPQADYTVFNRMHMWLKFGPPVAGVGRLQARIVNGDTGAFATVDLAGNADGAWHEVIVDMTGIAPNIKSTINKVGLFLPTPALAPPIPDAGPPPAPDAGVDALGLDGASDAAAPDAELADAGLVDAGSIDAGSVDAGAIDTGAVDSGAPPAPVPPPFTVAIDNIWLE